MGWLEKALGRGHVGLFICHFPGNVNWHMSSLQHLFMLQQLDPYNMPHYEPGRLSLSVKKSESQVLPDGGPLPHVLPPQMDHLICLRMSWMQSSLVQICWSTLRVKVGALKIACVWVSSMRGRFNSKFGALCISLFSNHRTTLSGLDIW